MVHYENHWVDASVVAEHHDFEALKVDEKVGKIADVLDVIVVHVNLAQFLVSHEHVAINRLQLIVIEKNDFEIAIFAEQRLVDVSNFICAER